MFTVYSLNNLNNQNVYYGAFTLNWWFLRLNPWPDCVVISRDIATYGSKSYSRFTRKMPNLLILKLIFSLLDCMGNLPIIIYIKPPIQNDSPFVQHVSTNCFHMKPPACQNKPKEWSVGRTASPIWLF